MWSRVSLGALALLLLVAALVLATRPSAWRVERSVMVAATPATVRAGLVEPRRWATWSPWAEAGQGAQWTFGGPPSGRGATAYWSADGSTWRLTVIAADGGTVAVELEREGRSPGAYDLAFTLVPEGAGTRLGWAARGEDDLAGRARALLWSHERELGPALELGLARLGAEAEAEARPFQVERTAHVAAGPAAVLAALTDLRRWRTWSPAGAGQPGAVWTYGGPEAGVGASAYWAGEGARDRGRLTVVRVEAGQVEVEQELEGSKASTCDHAISLAVEGAGTRVSWVARGARSPASSADRSAAGPEETLGSAVEAGLAGLKEALEGAAKP